MNRVLQNARWIGLGVALFVGAWSSESAAGPLVLRGTATVAFIEDDFTYAGAVHHLPLATHIGDTFAFTLYVHPLSALAGQPSGFAIFQASIGGVHLQHSHLEVHVGNNANLSALTLAAPRIEDHLAIVGDTILVRKPHEYAEVDFVGTTNVMGAPRFRLELGFQEQVEQRPSEELQIYPTILDDNSIPLNAATWQAFSHRELAIRFGNLSFVGAYIDTITLVPEPATFSICGCCFWPWLAGRFAHRRSTLVDLRLPPA